MKQLVAGFIFFLAMPVFASDIIPTGNDNNTLYYKIGGGSDFTMPPVKNNQTINLSAGADLGAGYTCGTFNPALSIQNTLNNLKSSVDNLTQTLLQNATGSLAEMPMYFLAQADPTLYNLLNNALLAAHEQLEISMKSCQEEKDEIAQGQNPFQNWGSIALGNQWKQQLSLTATGAQDLNTATAQVESHPGDAGIPWVQGSSQSDGSFAAGGVSQPPIHVITDTVTSGYNAILMRDLNDASPAPTGSELSTDFPAPSDAVSWITNVVGDQTITTCTDNPSCQSNQGGISGRGLLPWITNCTSQNMSYCSDTIKSNLANLVTNQTPVTATSLAAVSAEDLVISPQVITSLQAMDKTQQSILINKLALEVATQQVMSRALLAKNILQTGSQVPVIAANLPAQNAIHQAMDHLDKDIESLSFESQIRKQMMSDTVSQLLNSASNQQQSAITLPKVNEAVPLMQNSGISSTTQNTQNIQNGLNTGAFHP